MYKTKPLMVPNMSYRTLFNSTVDFCSIIQRKTHNILVTGIFEFIQRYGVFECPIRPKVNIKKC